MPEDPQPRRRPDMTRDLQGSRAPMAHYTIITVENDGTPVIDHEGLDPWAAYAIVAAATNEMWECLPTAVIRPPKVKP